MINFAYYATAFALFIIALKLLSGALLPLIMAALVTVVLRRFINRLSSKMKLRKRAVSVAVVLIFYGLFLSSVSVLGFFIYKQAVSLVLALPEEFEKIYPALLNITEKINSFLNKTFGEIEGLTKDFSAAAITSFSETTAGLITSAVGSIASSVPIFVISVFVMIAASAYLSKDYDDIYKFLKNRLNGQTFCKISYFKTQMVSSLMGMLKGYGVIMLITFSELLVGLWILKREYALIAAAVTAILDILPVLGSGTVLIPWALLAFLTGDKTLAFGLLVLYIIITAVRNVVEPKILGSRVGLPPIIMLISAFLGLKFFGASGIFLLPVAVLAAKVIIEGKKNNYEGNCNKNSKRKAIKRISIIKSKRK